MGDSMGEYLEFHEPSDENHLKIYKGLTIFKTNAGSVTDDSYMAMSLSFAIMDNNKLKELNQNLIFFYYGAWAMTNPPDMGNATNNVMMYFNYEKCIYGDNYFNDDIKKNIHNTNYSSKANGFLMRISTFVVFNNKNLKMILLNKKKKKKRKIYLCYIIKLKILF